MAVLSVGCADQSIEPMENIGNDIISRSMNSYSESTSNQRWGLIGKIWKKLLTIKEIILNPHGIQKPVWEIMSLRRI